MDTSTAQLYQRLKLYQITAIFSIMFALLGFSYNVWRLEQSEHNTTVRTASFELLKQLSLLEQIIYAAYYDKDFKEGNPRKGWVRVGLIEDLSALTSPAVQQESYTLKQLWQAHWQALVSQKNSHIETPIHATEQRENTPTEKPADILMTQVDRVRISIKQALAQLD